MPESPKRVRTRMLGLLELTKNAATRAPAGATLLHQAIADIDGYPATASGAGDGGGGGGGELSAVESAANRRLGDFYPTFDDEGRRQFRPGPTRQLERMAHLIGVATAAISEIITIADNVAPPPTVQSRDICVGGVGYEWWQAPDRDPGAVACTNVQEAGRASGLCGSCRARRQRYVA